MECVAVLRLLTNILVSFPSRHMGELHSLAHLWLNGACNYFYSLNYDFWAETFNHLVQDLPELFLSGMAAPIFKVVFSPSAWVLE